MPGRHVRRSTERAGLKDSVGSAVQITANTIKLAGAVLFAAAAIETAAYEPSDPQVNRNPSSAEEKARQALGANRFAECQLLGITVTQPSRYPGELVTAALTIRTQLDSEAQGYMAGTANPRLEWTEPDFVARELTTDADGRPDVAAEGSNHYLDTTDQPETYQGYLPATDNTRVPRLGVFVSYSATTFENGVETTTETEQYCGTIGRDAASSWQLVPRQHIPSQTWEFDGAFPTAGR